jgi:hypothetical protein
MNQTTGDLMTGDKQRRGTINKFDETNKIGSKKWIDKWSKYFIGFSDLRLFRLTRRSF